MTSSWLSVNHTSSRFLKTGSLDYWKYGHFHTAVLIGRDA